MQDFSWLRQLSEEVEKQRAVWPKILRSPSPGTDLGWEIVETGNQVSSGLVIEDTPITEEASDK